MRTALAALTLSLLALAGCGNSPVTVEGRSLQPKSAIMYNYILPGVSLTAVTVVDLPDLCGEYSKMDVCNPTVSPLAGRTTTMLYVMMPGVEAKRFDITATDGGSVASPYSSLSAAALMFAQTDGTNAQASYSDLATSGSIWLDDVKINDHASGHYDVTMHSGAHLTGTFTGTYCKAMDTLMQTISSGGATSCSGTTSAGVCTRSCTCQSRTVSSRCSVASGVATCTCTAKDGTTTSCTLGSRTTCSAAETCCPMTP